MVGKTKKILGQEIEEVKKILGEKLLSGKKKHI
jgi:hypothetical protein